MAPPAFSPHQANQRFAISGGRANGCLRLKSKTQYARIPNQVPFSNSLCFFLFFSVYLKIFLMLISVISEKLRKFRENNAIYLIFRVREFRTCPCVWVNSLCCPCVLTAYSSSLYFRLQQGLIFAIFPFYSVFPCPVGTLVSACGLLHESSSSCRTRPEWLCNTVTGE